MNTKNVITSLTASLLDEVKKVMKNEKEKGESKADEKAEHCSEALKGDQHKIDANKNGKVDAHDFKLLRKKKGVAETYSTMNSDEEIEEEVEDLEELSNSTLGSYTKKAAADFKDRKPKMGYDGQLKKMQNRNVGVGRALNKMYGEEVEEIDEDLGAQISELIRKKNATTSPITRKNIESQIAKLKRQKSKMNEEAEQIDELSKGTLGSYINKSVNKAALAHADVEKARHDYSAGAALDHATSGTPSHIRSKAKEVIQRDALDRESKAFRKVRNKITGIERATSRLTKEEVELTQEEIDRLDAMMTDLEEGRGRPPKEGSEAWKKRQAEGAAEQDEPRQHPIQQLERIKRDMRGGADFKHRDGSTHHLTGVQASKILAKYHGLKPAEKETMQKEIHGSHAGLKKHL